MTNLRTSHLQHKLLLIWGEQTYYCIYKWIYVVIGFQINIYLNIINTNKYKLEPRTLI